MIDALKKAPDWLTAHPHVWLALVIVSFVLVCCLRRKKLNGITEEGGPLLMSAAGIWGVVQLFLFAASKTATDLGTMTWPLTIAAVIAFFEILPQLCTRCWNMWSGPDIEIPSPEPIPAGERSPTSSPEPAPRGNSGSLPTPEPALARATDISPT